MSTSAGIGLLLAASLLTTTLSTTTTLAQSSGQTIKERVDTSAAKQSGTSGAQGISGAQKDAAKPAGPVTMDTYPRTKADRLADEQDKILDRKIKGICRGC